MRCPRCGSRDAGCTEDTCFAGAETIDENIEENLPARMTHTCGVCSNKIEPGTEVFMEGVPLHPVCKIAIEHELGVAQITRDTIAHGEPTVTAGNVVPENALVRPAIIRFECLVPVLLTPDNYVSAIREGIEAFLTDAIMAYKQGEIKYDWKTGEIDLSDVRRIGDLMSKPRIAKINEKIKANMKELAKEEDPK